MTTINKFIFASALGLTICTYSTDSFAANTTPANTISSPTNSNSVNNNTTLGTDWKSQSQYWSSNYTSRPYYTKGNTYSTYEPAYNYGVDLYNQNKGAPYQSLNEQQLRDNWTRTHPGSKLTWSQAQSASRDAYERLYNSNNTNNNNTNNTGSRTSGVGSNSGSTTNSNTGSATGNSTSTTSGSSARP